VTLSHISIELTNGSRLWVLQEAALAPSNTCHIGPNIIGLNRLIDAHQGRQLCRNVIYRKYEKRAAALLRSLALLYPRKPSSGLGFTYVTLSFLLSQSRQLDGTDARDHIFAILGVYWTFNATIASSIRDRLSRSAATFPKDATWLTPDYRKTVIEVFRDATRVIMNEEWGDEYRTTALLDINHKSLRELDNVGAPSWTIDWSSKEESWMTLSSKWFRDYDRFVPTPFTWSTSDSNLMCLGGIRIGAVQAHTYTFPKCSEDTRSQLHAWVQETLAQRYGDRSRLKDMDKSPYTVLTTRSEYRCHGYGMPKRPKPLDISECSAVEWLVQLLMPILPDRTYEDRGNWQKFEDKFNVHWRTIKSHCHQRRYFLLDSTRDNEEYIGVGPQLTAIGDVVVLSPRLITTNAPAFRRSLQAAWLLLHSSCGNDQNVQLRRLVQGQEH
jgi:hypothetical protein